ncbi:MAG: glycoside hydrolase family 13 protein [Candidatus Marinimicrobia bacterium]|nr:glycoside hydrolase family 13 protein [Candidatus Neomarinimicrobiota bacterium]
MKQIKLIIKVLLLIVVIESNLFGNVLPDWATDAVWYQIFPERFNNGDHANDPTLASTVGTWPWQHSETWNVSPWTSDWYTFQQWEVENGKDFRYQFQLRRYGGDLQGIIEKLDYLQELGVNAIYLNPVFDSPSSHKYGAATYHHIDRHFGPDPEGDTNIIQSESPNDPSTWKWTSADKLFLQLVEEVHRREMHIIIDGVFNHAGLTFWAFQDVIENREKSSYYHWYSIDGNGMEDHSHLNDYRDLPSQFNPDGYPPLRYKGYVEDLPAFRQNEDGPVKPVREHFKEIVRRWMDPNNDGDTSDGIDGWRLDVAERIQMSFWDEFCGWVKVINPNAYITGEVWWEDWWNNKQFNASPWLKDGRFDAVMNYRFGDAMFKYFIDRKNQITPFELDILLQQVRDEYPPNTAYVLQNCLGSHDMERLASAVVNPDRLIDHANNTWWNKEFDIRKPNSKQQQIQKTIILFQFSYLGAPYIYYGDEVGMWGADDPDCRKPMVWSEFSYENETAHPCDYLACIETRPEDRVMVDKDLWKYYHDLIDLRHKHPSLRRGNYKTVYTNSEGLFVFQRQQDNEIIICAFNGSNIQQTIPNIVFEGKFENWSMIFGDDFNKQLQAKSGKLFKKKL